MLSAKRNIFLWQSEQIKIIYAHQESKHILNTRSEGKHTWYTYQYMCIHMCIEHLHVHLCLWIGMWLFVIVYAYVYLLQDIRKNPLVLTDCKVGPKAWKKTDYPHVLRLSSTNWDQILLRLLTGRTFVFVGFEVCFLWGTSFACLCVGYYT